MLFKTTYRPLRRFVYVQIMLSGQEREMRYTVVGSAKSGLVWHEASDVAALLKKAGKSLPYVLHFRGFGVLTRISENVPAYREMLLVNGHEEDFYFNSMTAGGIGVSFLRLSLVQSLIDELRSGKAFVWSLHAGPVPLIALAEGRDLSMKYDFSVEIQGGRLVRLEKNNDTVKPLPGTFLSEDEAYIAAMRLLTIAPPEGYADGLREEERESVKSDFKEFTRFIKLGVGMLSIFFFALVGNYFYIGFLNDKAAQLESDIAGYGEDLALTERLGQEKSRKTMLVENSGVQSRRYLTFYLDEIGSSVPATIQLETLDAFPLTQALKPKRKVELNRENITVTGFSSDSKVLDDWMEMLEKKSWIKAVELINYVRINDRKAAFNLLIRIKV
jgi:Tfp pilus assembly protein PilN